MTVSAKYQLRLDVDETVSLGEELVNDPVLKHAISGESGTLDASSAVPATKPWSDERSLAGGADTLDLTALPRPNLPSVDLTGLKVQLVKIKADAANTDKITIKPGATNAYHIFGSAASEIVLAPGDQAMFFFQDSLPDVAAGAKEVDLSSPDADATYQIILVAG